MIGFLLAALVVVAWLLLGFVAALAIGRAARNRDLWG